MLIAVLTVGMLIGFVVTRNSVGKALALYDNHNSENYASSSGSFDLSGKVDRQTLQDLYVAVFGRPLDEEGARFHVGKNLKVVLNDISSSDEHRYYSALFKSVKAYEEALRAPGTLNAEDKKRYLDGIDSALATLIAWVETLPKQPICNATIGPEEAREAIQEAFNHMNQNAQNEAKQGIFNAMNHMRPDELPLPLRRCIVPSPSSSTSPSPSISPSVSPSWTPTPSRTATPTPSQ